MSQSGSSQTEARVGGSALYGIYVLSLAVSLVGNLLTRIGAESGVLPAWGQAVVGAAATIPLMVAAVMFWRLLRRDLDEMLQRIVLEGLAFAVIVYVPLTALYVNLRTAGSHVQHRCPAPRTLSGIPLPGGRHQQTGNSPATQCTGIRDPRAPSA